MDDITLQVARTAAHRDAVRRWLTDPDIRLWLGGYDPHIDCVALNGSAQGDVFFIIVCDGVDAGFVHVQIDGDRAGWVAVAVASEHRGRGVAEIALREMKAWAAAVGVTVLYAEVEQRHPVSVNLVRRAGFSEVDGDPESPYLRFAFSVDGQMP